MLISEYRKRMSEFAHKNRPEFARLFKGADLAQYWHSTGLDIVKFDHEVVDTWGYVRFSQLANTSIENAKEAVQSILLFENRRDSIPLSSIIAKVEKTYGAEAIKFVLWLRDNPRSFRSEVIRVYGQDAWNFIERLRQTQPEYR